MFSIFSFNLHEQKVVIVYLNRVGVLVPGGRVYRVLGYE